MLLSDLLRVACTSTVIKIHLDWRNGLSIPARAFSHFFLLFFFNFYLFLFSLVRSPPSRTFYVGCVYLINYLIEANQNKQTKLFEDRGCM